MDDTHIYICRRDQNCVYSLSKKQKADEVGDEICMKDNIKTGPQEIDWGCGLD
jgi:hypothetical protein